MLIVTILVTILGYYPGSDRDRFTKKNANKLPVPVVSLKGKEDKSKFIILLLSSLE